MIAPEGIKSRTFGARHMPDPKKVHYPKHLRKKKIGIYLGTYYDPVEKVTKDLRTDDVQPRGALIMGPPGSGKSTCCFIPTLLTYDESAFVYDPKGELYFHTAGYRRDRMKQKILVFKPTDPSVSCKINIFDAIRWNTQHTIDDVQSQVKLILDPSDKAAEGAEAHWIVCGSILLECTMMFLRYYDPSMCNLAGCYDFLTDPRWEDPDDEDAPQGIDACLEFMANTPLDPQLKHGWEVDGVKTPFLPYIVHSALEVKRKPTNEKGGVVSTTTRFLQPFRSDTLRALTSSSDFAFDDLMNYKRPVTLYFIIPPNEIQRLRVVVRLFLNLLVRAHTGDEALIFKNGKPHYRYRWRCLLAVDEFPQLGKQEQFMLALAVMRSYGLWPMLGVQAPNQLYEAFGRYQAVTGMLYYKVFYKPNDPEAAEWISKFLGQTTSVKVTQSYSGSRFGIKTQVSETISPEKEPLMDPGMLMGMPEGRAIICYGSEDPELWTNPIWGGKLYYKSNPELLRRSEFAPPAKSDVITAPPAAPVKRGAEELLQAARDAVAKAAGPPPAAPAVPSTETQTTQEETTAAATGDVDAAAAAAPKSTVEPTPEPTKAPVQELTPADAVASAEALLRDNGANTIANADVDEEAASDAQPADPIEQAHDDEDGEAEEEHVDDAAAGQQRSTQMRDFLAIADHFGEPAEPEHELPDHLADSEEPFEDEDEA
jgi:type IV secretion system protein VirD4